MSNTNTQTEPRVIANFRRIVTEWQHGRIDGAAIDATTASIVCQIYDKLNETNRAKLATFPARRIALVCLELAGLK